MVETVDAVGQTIGKSFDELSRLTGMILTEADGLTVEDNVTFTYDALGQKTGAVDGDSSLAWSYDGANRVATASTVAGPLNIQPAVVLTHGYDAVGNRTDLTHGPDGMIRAPSRVRLNYNLRPGNRWRPIVDRKSARWDPLDLMPRAAHVPHGSIYTPDHAASEPHVGRRDVAPGGLADVNLCVIVPGLQGTYREPSIRAIGRNPFISKRFKISRDIERTPC